MLARIWIPCWILMLAWRFSYLRMFRVGSCRAWAFPDANRDEPTWNMCSYLLLLMCCLTGSVTAR